METGKEFIYVRKHGKVELYVGRLVQDESLPCQRNVRSGNPELMTQIPNSI
jgi:hypothetical protein